MINSLKNLTLFENIDYIHFPDEVIYQETFNNLINENLKFHSKDIFIKQLKLNYPDIADCITNFGIGIGKDIVYLFYNSIIKNYTIEQLDKIISKYAYTVSKVYKGLIILRPINNIETRLTDYYFHLSSREDLGRLGLKTKSSDLNGFEKYDKRIYLYPLVFDDNDTYETESIYDLIKDKAKIITKRFNDVRHTNNTHYIYLVNLPNKNYTLYKDTAQSKDYAVYVKNDIPAKYVNLIGEI